MKESGEELAMEVVKKLQGAGHVAYFAGGCVRDRLMGREPKDFDVATSAVPEQVLNIFPRGQQVGAAFGVILVKRGKAQVEVATFRADGVYSDGRRPDSVTFTTAEKDASRRDFTCNAIFFDPVSGNHFDFVGGKADIAAKVLRAVGDPELRFAEDRLRMMRAIRFAAKLGFTIEEATFAAIRGASEKIGEISKERVGEELRMMLEHESRRTAIELLAATGLLKQIWPRELIGAEDLALHFFRGQRDMSRVAGIVAIQLGMGIQGVDTRKAATVLQAAFVLSNDEATEVAWLLHNSLMIDALCEMMRARIKRMMAPAYFETLWKIWRGVLEPAYVTKAEERIAQMRSEGASPEPFVTGDELIKLGAKPGREFKKWLEALYDRQLELEFSSRDEAIAAARELIAQG